MRKHCARCGELREHSVRPSGGPVSYCKICVREYSRAHYQANKHKHNARRVENNRRNRRTARQRLDELKSVPCADCGQKFHPCVMDFDHLDGSTKIGNVSELIHRVPMDQVLAEAAKCEVVCANCHRLRTWRRRTGLDVHERAVA